MDALKKKRAVVRAAFTRIYNSLEERRNAKVNSEMQDDVEIMADLDLLREKFEDLAHLDADILDLLLQNTDTQTQDLDKEVQAADEYSGKYKRISLYLQKSLNAVEDSVSDINITKRKFKLPALELKKFGGEVKDWLTFWGQFKKINDDPDIDDSDKFQYLLQAMEINTRAREVVESFPPIGSNYSKAIECLKARFGREDVLVEFYVRELLKLTLAMNSKHNQVSLSSLYDKIETQLRALETLGVATDKYAAMLFPLVESCLTEEVLRAWQRSYNTNSAQPDGKTRLDSLMSFLKCEVENEERITMAVQGFRLGSSSKVSTKALGAESSNNKNNSIPTAAGLVNFKPNKRSCVFCEGNHSSDACFKAQKMEFEEKRIILNRRNCCFSCLKSGHVSRKCKTMLKCIICEGKHVPVMCPRTNRQQTPNEGGNVENSLSNVNCSQVFLQTLMVTIRGEHEKQVRVLMDPGSQRSYIRKDTARCMGYEPIGDETLIHGLFGGKVTNPKPHLCYKVRLKSLDEKYACNFEALDEENICSHVPVIQPGPWLTETIEKGIKLFDQDKPVEVLVGADVYGKLLTGRREILQCGLVALETYLGWIVTGKIMGPKSSNSMTALSMFAHTESVSKLWELDAIGIQDPGERKNKEEREQATQTYFLDTVKVNEEGRYEVRLPWIEGHPPVPRNFNLGKRRMEHTLKKLEDNGSKAIYDGILKEWTQEGIIEEVPVSQWDEGHYLPHRPIFKENSTTRVRPVFDASSRERGYPSLNQCLEKGINLIEIIPTLLLRFRLYQIGVIADIRKAFLQISLCEEDRDFLRFLWVDMEGEMKIFRHARVVFGVTSSPFLLGAVIDFHLKCFESRGDEMYSTATIKKLRKSFYVDNCVTSLQSAADLHCFQEEATKIFRQAKFDLRGWEYSDSNLTDKTATPVLGLIWDRKCDTLAVSGCKPVDMKVVTRRTILSIAQRVFDPIGFTCPVSLCPKLLLQQCWAMKGGWDEEVPDDVKNAFLAWLQKLPLLEEVKIPRWLMGMNDTITSCSVHTFCDASKLAYAAAVFLRLKYNSYVHVQLIQAKSRVSPLKEMTIPRLELLAATIGARLTASLRKEFEELDTDFFFWSDSTTVITWIQREDHWGVFVWNRVQEIKSLTVKEAWRHIPGNMNPADLASRGCSAEQLLKSRWWEGPPWLKLPLEEWPSEATEPDEEMIRQERRKVTTSTLLNTDSDCDRLYNFSNDYDKVVRVIAWILRFINSCRRKDVEMQSELQQEEFNVAEKYLVRLVQRESFSGVKDDKLSTLCPFMDVNGIIRLRTKITERRDLEDFRIPAVLPSKHPVVEKIVLCTHIKSCHVGVQGLLSHLREKFWILKGRKTVRAILTSCVICRRYEARSVSTSTPALPEPRVRDAVAFETTGIDLAGPLHLRDNSKVWICLYTCAVYRAVHLELTSSLSMDSFLQTFRRFVARRGRPSIVYTDNGGNFVGTNNAFSQLDWDKISKYSAAHQIDWRFNPPTAAWWGGWWERLIRLLKQLLRKTLGKASLTYEELETVLCDCEAVMNSRPLTYVSEDSADLAPITPNMFLLDVKEMGVPDCDLVNCDNLNRRSRNRQRIRDSFRQRFRKEYLGQLALATQKKTRKLLLGEVVLVGADNLRRIDWPLAVVEQLIPGRDGEIRVVRLKTASGVLFRPVQRVYPLEIRAEQAQRKSELLSNNSGGTETRMTVQDSGVVKLVQTRCGRKVQIPARYLT